MTWLWIIVIIAIYLIFWVLTAVIAYKEDTGDVDICTFYGLFWPIALPVIVVRIIVEKIVEL